MNLFCLDASVIPAASASAEQASLARPSGAPPTPMPR
jgi:hypothetical protein